MVEFLQEEISVIAKNIQKNELTITIDNECYILGDIKYKTKQKENKEKLSTNNIDKFFDGIANCLDADKNTNIPLICHYQTNRNIHSISLGNKKAK